MKKLISIISVIAAVASISLSVNSCTDPVKFGNDFLEKAPGGTVTADTVFTNAEYTRQFLSGLYKSQYYPLPTSSTNSAPQCLNYWKGTPDALSDCIQFFFANTIVNNKYYTGAMTSSYDQYGNGTIYPYINESIWESIHNCYIFLEKIDAVPGIETDEKERMKDEARCLIANVYFTAFRFYGGLPIITKTYSGSDTEYEVPRASVKGTVDFMIGLLDGVINGNRIPFTYKGRQDEKTETGRWTIAAAMLLKVKILQFAASPLFNDSTPYWGTKYKMEQEDAVWLGSYNASLWSDLKTACEAFISRNTAEGTPYKMVEPLAKTQEAYAYAFRSAYLLQDSPEVIHSVRVTTTAGSGYAWWNLGRTASNKQNPRMAYCPTQEYVEMFPWADGTPFDWDELAKGDKTGYTLDNMFIKGQKVDSEQMLQNIVYTRDPRLYENVAVNGQRQTINWGNGVRNGAPYETFLGGTEAKQNPKTQADHYGTGYRHLKYIAGEAFGGKYTQWVELGLSDFYLTYAEALLQTGANYKDVITYVDKVRERTGLGGLEACNPKLDLTKKDVLLDEILRERACELLFTDSRYFDLIRYKRSADFEKPLHRLVIHRIVNGAYDEKPWYNGDRTSAAKFSERWYEPSHFEYEKLPITNLSRIWWTQGFDPKWYLAPFPVSEVNKGYGLVQNPGW